MYVLVDKSLDEIIPRKYRKLRKVFQNLRTFDDGVYRSIENEVYEAFSNNPSEDEVADYVLENYKHIFSHFSSPYIPPEYQEDEDED